MAVSARVPDGNFRINRPDGFLHDFEPLQFGPELTAIGPGAWWVNGATRSAAGTVGSPMTEPDTPGSPTGRLGVVPAAVTRCMGVIVNSVVQTRWVARNARGDVLPMPLWIRDPMLLGRSPGVVGPMLPAEQRLDGRTFWATLLSHAILWGQGVMIYQPNMDGEPIPGSCIIANPLSVLPLPGGGWRVNALGFDRLDTDLDGGFEFAGARWRIAVVRGLPPADGLLPQGVLARHFRTLRIGASVSGYLDGMFRSGVPSGYLQVTTPNWGGQMVDDPDNPGSLVAEQELLKRRWMASHGSGWREVAVLNTSVNYTPIAMKPVDADVAKVASVSRVDIAHAFEMSSVWLDEGMSGLNYSNSSERRADLVALTSSAWGERLCAMLSALMPYGQDVHVSWQHFIQPSIETLAPQVVNLLWAGVLTPREAREWIGQTPWTGPDPDWSAA